MIKAKVWSNIYFWFEEAMDPNWDKDKSKLKTFTELHPVWKYLDYRFGKNNWAAYYWPHYKNSNNGKFPKHI